MSVKLVILDCDGVLVDSEPITNRILAEDMTRHGLPLSTGDAMELFVGGTIKSAFDKALALGAALPNDWVENFYERMIETLGHEVVAIEGAHGLLDWLDTAGVHYCVASNGPMRKMDVTLKRTGLWPRVEGRIFSAHDVGVAKPDPGLFLHAANVLGLTRDTPAAKLTAHGAEPIAWLDQVPDRLGLS